MKKHFLSIVVVVMLTLVLAACSSNEEKKEAAAKEESDGVTTVNVGTMGTYHPFSYEDDKGELTGYDLEVLRLVEEVDPTLKFNFIAGPWDSLFVGLDAGKFDLLANQIVETDERKEKYTLSENQYFTSVSQIIVSESNNDVKSLNDLVDGKIGLTVGDSHTFIVEDWNKANGNILDNSLVFYEQDVTTLLQDIASGRLDAAVNDPIVAKEKAEVQGLSVKVVGDRLNAVPTYFVAKQDDAGKELIAKIDAALEKLIADGKLTELSMEYFGEDYSK